MEATKHANIFDVMETKEDSGNEAKNLGSVSTGSGKTEPGQPPPRIWLHKADEGDSWACAVWSETSSSASAENVPYVPEASYGEMKAIVGRLASMRCADYPKTCAETRIEMPICISCAARKVLGKE